MNKVIHGDCLAELKKLKPGLADVVYLDPPFFTQRKHSQLTRDNSKQFQFDDTWASLSDYLKFVRATLKQSKRLLKVSGSIFLHCDKSASHHLRVLLDKVFGVENFQSEIVWHYKRWSNAKKGLLNSHQTIFFYSKTQGFKFNTLYTDYSATTNVDQILQARARDKHGKAVYKKDESGNVINGKAKKGVPMSDVWDIPYLNPKAKERVGYPTQKPILLLRRIIEMTTNPSDLILDPFCGSGTTLVAASLLQRNFIGIDKSMDAVALTLERLKNPVTSTSNLLLKGEAPYLNKTEKELLVLKGLDAVPVQRNSGIDGFLKRDYRGKPVAVRVQKEGESLEEAKNKLREAKKARDCSLLLLIRTHNRFSERAQVLGLDTNDEILVLNAYEVSLEEVFQNEKAEHQTRQDLEIAVT